MLASLAAVDVSDCDFADFTDDGVVGRVGGRDVEG